MTEKAEMLRQLVETRIAVEKTYTEHIAEGHKVNAPWDYMEMLTAERDELLDQFTQRIDRLREEIAK
jgi:hypothetical protein